MKKIVSVILTLVLALGLALPAVAEDAIKIGVIGPLTGPAAIYGTAVANGAPRSPPTSSTPWAALQIELDAQDDEHDPEKAINAYNTLLGLGRADDRWHRHHRPLRSPWLPRPTTTASSC